MNWLQFVNKSVRELSKELRAEVKHAKKDLNAAIIHYEGAYGEYRNKRYGIDHALHTIYQLETAVEALREVAKQRRLEENRLHTRIVKLAERISYLEHTKKRLKK